MKEKVHDGEWSENIYLMKLRLRKWLILSLPMFSIIYPSAIKAHDVEDSLLHHSPFSLTSQPDKVGLKYVHTR